MPVIGRGGGKPRKKGRGKDKKTPDVPGPLEGPERPACLYRSCYFLEAANPAMVSTALMAALMSSSVLKGPTPKRTDP